MQVGPSGRASVGRGYLSQKRADRIQNRVVQVPISFVGRDTDRELRIGFRRQKGPSACLMQIGCGLSLEFFDAFEERVDASMDLFVANRVAQQSLEHTGPAFPGKDQNLDSGMVASTHSGFARDRKPATLQTSLNALECPSCRVIGIPNDTDARDT